MTKLYCVTGINWINPNYLSSKTPSWNMKVHAVVNILSEIARILMWSNFNLFSFYLSSNWDCGSDDGWPQSRSDAFLISNRIVFFLRFSATACLLSSTDCGYSLYIPSTSQLPRRGSAGEYIRQNVFMLRSAVGRPTTLENKEKRFKTHVRIKTATSALCFMMTAVP